ncbi:rod shape-determining protein MreC [Clostridium sp. YIM B02551]|uniref:rod shape-determining protein MreC n=1 Tax=Clostridium sp. YIM B02551 TaxID=2910679 RepID=UPI001EEA9789|nr:rod shape-determining protein MreC [Clostridium sp. YIM B02551]
MKFLKNKLAVTIIVLSVGFLAIIVYTFKSQNKSIFESGAGSALNPIQKIAYTVTEKFKGFADFFYNFSEVKEENKKLAKENAELNNKLVEYNSLKSENERLRDVVNFANQIEGYSVVGTNIIGYSGDSFLSGYVIDKGSKDGLEKGMPVMASKGIVGQVTSIGSNWAIVQSLVNENIAIAAKIESTEDTIGIVKGYKDSQNKLLAKVYNIPVDSQIKKGDVILTSGLGSIYPKNIRIGTVLSVEEDKVKVSKSATIEPFVDFNKLEELFIMIPKEKRKIESDGQ